MRRSYGVSAIAAGLMLLGYQAMAMAPVITDLPSVIVGNESIATPPNAFVYPDAFNLDNYVSDAVTSDAGIIWSYEAGTSRYSINGVATLNGGDPNAPGAAGIGNDSDPAKLDALPHTITIRDTSLSPIGGPNTDPGTGGILNPAGEIVTLFASDGTSYSMADMLIYTDDGGDDRLSTAGTVIQQVDFLTQASTTDWITNRIVPGSDVSSNNNGEGLCVQVPLSNVSLSEWISPYGFITLIPNTAWRIRMNVDAGSIAANTTPLWSIVVDNFSNDTPPSVIENKYGQESLILDNIGGANGAGGALKDYDVWFVPIAVNAADWNDVTNGMFTSAKEAINDARVHFRVYDIDDSPSRNGNYGGQLDAGKLCLKAMTITAFGLDTLPVVATPYNQTNMTLSTHSVGSIFSGSTNAAVSNGGITITPANGTAWDLEIVSCNPGNTTFDAINNPNETPDNFPVQDVADGLFRVTIGIKAADAAGETNPPDGLRMGMDDASTEVLEVGNVLATTNALGMPKQNVVTDYTALYASNALTASSIANIDRVRPRMDLLNTTNVGLNGQTHNTGGVTVTYMRVDQLQAP
jgi:hypothetical protein